MEKHLMGPLDFKKGTFCEFEKQKRKNHKINPGQYRPQGNHFINKRDKGNRFLIIPFTGIKENL